MLGSAEAEALAGDIFFRPWRQRVLAACLGSDLPSVLKRIGWAPRLTAFARHPLSLASFLARDFYRRACRWTRPTGLLIAVLGTDGTGKSTLIEDLRLRLAPAFRRVMRFHWAPRVIVPRKHAPPNTHPHAKPSRGALLSSCFLLAVTVDYWIGYLISLKQSRARSGLILFDRYFHDVLIDPRRYRYGGPAWFARWMARLVPSPDLVVILDADERVIGARKAELPAEEISRQRQKYKELQFPGAEKIVVNTEKGEDLTLDKVSYAIVEHLARRFESRHPEWLPMKEAR
jgi:thymidylate kinase